MRYIVHSTADLIARVLLGWVAGGLFAWGFLLKPETFFGTACVVGLMTAGMLIGLVSAIFGWEESQELAMNKINKIMKKKHVKRKK